MQQWVSLTASYQEGVPEPPTFRCVTDNNIAHIDQGRAYRCGWWYACAVGSRDNLGLARTSVVSSLQRLSDDYWEKTDSCP
jgi:alpha-tubulin suppressor-like RCC1 family protein